MADEHDKQPDLSQMFVRMSEVWRESLEAASAAGKRWSDSMTPFLTTRAADGGFFSSVQGGEVSEAIKRMVEGPRLADIWDFDRQIYALTLAWMEVQQRMAAYHAVVSVPWNRAFERYNATLKEAPNEYSGKDGDWRRQFGVWSGIANEELIRNQRSEAFLTAQRELLRSALELRTQQRRVADTVTKVLGLPTQQDFDEVTRQLTELRRELRAHVRRQRRGSAAGGGAAPSNTRKRSDGRKA